MNASVLFLTFLLAIILSAVAVSAMSPLDAFEEARRHHREKNDHTFDYDDYDVNWDHIAMRPQMRNSFGHAQPPMPNQRMKHMPGAEHYVPHHGQGGQY